MTIVNWVLVCAIVGVFAASLATTIVGFVKRKKLETKKNNQTTYNNSIENEVKAQQIISTETAQEKTDIEIDVKKTIIVSKNGTLRPGKYSILSAEPSIDAFNVRIGKSVKEYRHGDVVVVAEGEEVTPISHKIILR